jgi:hypothetical protein
VKRRPSLPPHVGDTVLRSAGAETRLIFASFTESPSKADMYSLFLPLRAMGLGVRLRESRALVVVSIRPSARSTLPLAHPRSPQSRRCTASWSGTDQICFRLLQETIERPAKLLDCGHSRPRRFRGLAHWHGSQTGHGGAFGSSQQVRPSP